MNIKRVFFDIDDTILQNNDNSTISTDLIKRISEMQEKGIKVHLATGRGYVSTVPVAKALGIKDELILYNGAVVVDVNGNILLNNLVDKKVYRELIKISREENVHLNLYYNDTIYVEKYDEHIKDYMSKTLQGLIIRDFDDYDNEFSIKCLFIDETDVLDELKKKIESRISNIYIVRSTPNYLEVLNEKANKVNGVKFVLNKYGVDKNEAMAFGDQNNDYDMLKYVGHGYIMGNAKQELKDLFDENKIAGHTKEQGVLNKINEVIFGI
ncbi:Cof-type HAD-IIB family hydrolase [Caviibacter abscessus]|uniref:Cof-type HAD-IIB family hydrolase n=1 Tax=Caviibacter abscessus TaxID=1766719 RepID=UPI00082A0622|nr:Cof-type HAD-IIB family hydrolase [Caviibacter abscessus]